MVALSLNQIKKGLCGFNNLSFFRQYFSRRSVPIQQNDGEVPPLFNKLTHSWFQRLSSIWDRKLNKSPGLAPDSGLNLRGVAISPMKLIVVNNKAHWEISIMRLIILTLFSSAVFFATPAYATKKMKSKKYNCSDLIESAIDHKTVLLKAYFSSVYVHSSAAKCTGHWQEPVESYWPSKDVKRCNVGYKCQARADGR